MHKHIVLAVLVLSGCATPFGKGGKDALNAALETPAAQPAALVPPPAAVQQAVMDAVVSLKQRYNLTVVLSEQFARPILPVIDRGYVVENGMLALAGTGPDLMQNPEIKSAYFGL